MSSPAAVVLTQVNPMSRISAAINLLMTILEKISDEDVWKNLFGERMVNLGQKYFGNDFVALSLAFYIAPILRTHWSKLVEWLCKKAGPAGYVTISIPQYDGLYSIISKYVYEHGKHKNSLTVGTAQYAEDSLNSVEINEYESDTWSSFSDYTDETSPTSVDSVSAQVKLLPPSDFDEELEYKGHLVKVQFKEADGETCTRIEVSMRSRDTKLLHCILQEWSDEYNTTQVSRDIWRSEQGYWSIEKPLPVREIESVHLKEGLLDHLLMDIQTFKSKQEWFTRRGIPHRRGYMFYGPPGTGKTSTIQAIAYHLGYDIAILNFADGMSNNNLKDTIKNVPHNSIIVIEDVDHLFESNASDKNKKNAITMSGLLNVLDGMQSREGAMIFMTCNNMEKITPALLRPGRIDLKLKFDYAEQGQIRDTYWRFMGLDEETSLPVEEEDRALAEKYADVFVNLIPKDQEITTAELQSFFIDVLLEANSTGLSRQQVYESFEERVPKFLEQVKTDREQAEKHREDLAKAEESNA